MFRTDDDTVSRVAKSVSPNLFAMLDRNKGEAMTVAIPEPILVRLELRLSDGETMLLNVLMLPEGFSEQKYLYAHFEYIYKGVVSGKPESTYRGSAGFDLRTGELTNKLSWFKSGARLTKITSKAIIAELDEIFTKAWKEVTAPENFNLFSEQVAQALRDELDEAKRMQQLANEMYVRRMGVLTEMLRKKEEA